MTSAPPRVEVLADAARVAALAHPIRIAILDALREANSATGVARDIAETRQKTNYHVKALLDAGLIEPAGERRRGNFVEQLYRSVAPTFLVAPALTWSGDRRTDALRNQVPLENLVRVGERLQNDAAALLDRAAFDGDDIAAAAVEAEVRFTDEATRAAFLEEYLAAVKPLLQKYGRKRGDAYRVVLAAYPDREGDA
jgi:DNA-binding transcriptional ArsR family regulator